MAGIVLNDVFDAQIDAAERPQRPIPSGRVSLATARIAGWQFLAGGSSRLAGEAFGRGFSSGNHRHNVGRQRRSLRRLLKRTPIGPLGTACRMLNVLLE